MKILILGANGFIGSHLCEAILNKTSWHIFALDIQQDKLSSCINHPRFTFKLGDMRVETAWITQHIQKATTVVPLAATATAKQYVDDPLGVFEIDFEANLSIVRQCVHFSKHIIFPSTSEVYGMCQDALFDEEESYLITGPIHKERWIYASAKQLLDRIIYAYGKHHQFNYTIFRPFNWYGPKLDSVLNPKPQASRVLTQFIGNVLRGEDLLLADGGHQRRSFTYIDDGIDALLKIITNQNNNASRRIFNIGNPAANVSIFELANMLLSLLKNYPRYKSLKVRDVPSSALYGAGYQEMLHRIPSISRAEKYLGWQPHVDLTAGLKATLDFYLNAGPSAHKKAAALVQD